MPTTFPYNRNIPLSTNKPSADQPLMQVNTNSTQDIIKVDHVGFGLATGVQSDGYHNTIHQVPFSTITTNPPGNSPVSAPSTFNTGGVLFTAEVRNPNSGGGKIDTNLYFKSELGQVSQLTGSIPGTLNQSGFGVNGFFINGPFMFQWGSATVNNSSTNTVNFSPVFANTCFSIVASFISGGGAPICETQITDNTKFNIKVIGLTGGAGTVSWLAIGN